MAIKYIPDDTEVSLKGQKEYEAKLISLLQCTINELHHVKKQLEILTEEEIDQDERLL